MGTGGDTVTTNREDNLFRHRGHHRNRGRAAAAEYKVDLEGRTDAFNGEFGAFFPKAWSARPATP